MTFLPHNLDVDQIMRGFQEEPTNPEIKEMQAVEGGLDISQTDSSTGTSGPWKDSEMRSGAFPLNKSILAEENRPTDAADVSSQTVATNYYPVFGNFTLEKIIESIDGAGSYQRMLVMCSMLCMFGSSFVSFCISFLAAEPLFKCEKADQPGTFVDCSERIACQESNPQVYFRYRGWPERLHLYCGKSELREHGKAICLLANAISCFLFLFLSDVFGRRGAIRINSALVLASLLLAYCLEDYYYKMFFIGVAFGCEGGLGALYIILINEVSDSQSKLKSKISAYTLASFSFGIVSLNLMSFIFRSADTLLLAMFFCLVVMYYPNFVVLYESPSWLLKKKQAARAVETFRKIAIFNSRHLPPMYFQEMQRTLEQDILQETVEMTNTEEESRFSILFLRWQNLKPLLILSTVSIGLFCNVYAMSTSIQDMGLEPIQLNGILIGITQAVGFLISLRYLANTMRRHALIFVQASMILSGFLLTTLEYLPDVKIKKVCQGFVANIVISLCIAAYFSFLYIVNAESFPVQVKGIAVGLILFVGKLVGSLAPYISLLSRKMRVHPMVGASFPLFGSLLLTMFLKETLKPILRPHMLLGPSQIN